MVIWPAAFRARVITSAFTLTALKSQKLPSITLNSNTTTSHLIYDLETVVALLGTAFWVNTSWTVLYASLKVALSVVNGWY